MSKITALEAEDLAFFDPLEVTFQESGHLFRQVTSSNFPSDGPQPEKNGWSRKNIVLF